MAAVLFATGALGGGPATTSATTPITVDLTSATSPGTDPFFPSVAIDPVPPSIPATPAVPDPSVTPDATAPAGTPTATPAPSATPRARPTGTPIPANKVFAFPKVPSTTGDSPGLYGGTRSTSSCNAKQMVKYLKANPAKARAWIAVQNADPTLRWSGGKLTLDNLDRYIATLTPLVLRYNTYLVNHGFNNNAANPLPEFLLAGNAVLVDRYGVPRARCYCGNPLTQAKGNPQQVRYRGVPGGVFDPNKPSVVVPAPAKKEIKAFKVVDTTTGQVFQRPVGTTGTADQKVNQALPTPSPAPTASAAAATPTPAATVSTPPILPGTVFNNGLGVVPPAGYAVRSNAHFGPYQDVPTIEIAPTDVNAWLTPNDVSQAGFSVSDLTLATVDPYEFYRKTGEDLAQYRRCNGDKSEDNFTYTGANGVWTGFHRSLLDCDDTTSGVPQSTELFVLKRQGDGATVALLVRGPAAGFDATRTLALQTLSTYQRQ